MHSFTMSEKERQKVDILNLLELGKLSRQEAAKRLGVSLRQIDRLRCRLHKEGIGGIVHKSRGKKSNHALKEAFKERITQIIRLNYSDFGPTLAAEKLLDQHNLKISREKLRQLMQEAGLWKIRKRKGKQYHPRRPRRTRRGEMLQGDGSDHDWFESRGPRCVLVALIDDATNTAYGRFYDAETAIAYMDVFKRYLLKYGLPLSLYVDKDSIFRVNRDEAKKSEMETQFGRMMKELNVDLICAHSPQAKGRIERLFETLQDRLVKEMRLRNICDKESANAYLENEFWDYFNKRWTICPENSEDAHRKLPSEGDLERIFTFRNKRKLSKSLDFSYKGMLYQVETATPHRVSQKHITICERADGSFWTECEGEKLQIKPFCQVFDASPIKNEKEINAFLNRKGPMTAIQKYRKSSRGK